MNVLLPPVLRRHNHSTRKTAGMRGFSLENHAENPGKLTGFPGAANLYENL